MSEVLTTADNTKVGKVVVNPDGSNIGSSPGTGATSLGKAEDAAHASGDTGIAVWAVRKDTAVATAADGDYHPFLVDSTGRLYVNTEGAEAAALADATANPTVPSTGTLPHSFNGATWDRTRGTSDVTVLASAARTANTNSSDLTNYNGRSLHLVIDVTSVTDTPSITVTVQGKDVLSGKYYTVLASAAITATGTTVLKVFPAATAAANSVANDILPRTWRVSVTHADADSITYSIGASII